MDAKLKSADLDMQPSGSVPKSATPKPHVPRLKEAFPSVVAVLGNAERFAETYLQRLHAVMSSNFEHYEIIVVDDGSSDGTAEIISAAQKKYPSIVRYSLIRPHGIGVAQIAGLDNAIGDFTIILDPRLDQPEIIPDMVEKALDGADLVYALPKDRVTGQGAGNKMANWFLKSVAKAKRIDLPPSTSSCRLFSRTVLNFVVKLSDRHRVLTLAPAMAGFGYDTLVYEREYIGLKQDGSDTGKPSTGPLRMFQRIGSGLRLLFGVSVTPLRMASWMALSVSALTLLYSLYVVIAWLLLDQVAPGWVSLSLQISGLFFVTSLVLAVLSEYVLQVLDSTGRRPLYFVAGQNFSDQLSYDQSLNVIARESDTASTHTPGSSKS